MHTNSVDRWQHDHIFGQDQQRVGERRTLIVIAVFAILMVWESFDRLLDPVPIAFNSAILVAVVGLVVNGGCALILDAGHSHSDDQPHHHDHNLRSAYLHVIADALTSVLAIAALLTGKYVGWNWMDPLMGMVGATLVARWSVGLLRTSAGVLLDHQAPQELREGITKALERVEGDRVADLHVWSIGPGIWAAELVVVTDAPQPADHYKARLPDELHLVHVSVEAHRCPGPEGG